MIHSYNINNNKINLKSKYLFKYKLYVLKKIIYSIQFHSIQFEN